MVVIGPDHKAGYFLGGSTLGEGWLTSHKRMYVPKGWNDSESNIVTSQNEAFSRFFSHEELS